MDTNLQKLFGDAAPSSENILEPAVDLLSLLAKTKRRIPATAKPATSDGKELVGAAKRIEARGRKKLAKQNSAKDSLPADAAPIREEEQKPAEKKLLEDPTRLARTLFIGNLTIGCVQDKATLRAFKKLLSAYGKIESIRFRSIAFEAPIPRKQAFIEGRFHKQRETVHAYAVMDNADSAEKALALNATIFEGRHLRMDLARDSSSTAFEQTLDTKKTVFLGNLPLNIEDEPLWKFFAGCGTIVNVRIVRDRKTNLGKGFGFVSFTERSAVPLALQMAGLECNGRPIRVTRCSASGEKSDVHATKHQRKPSNKPPGRPAKGKAAKGVSASKDYAAAKSKKKGPPPIVVARPKRAAKPLDRAPKKPRTA